MHAARFTMAYAIRRAETFQQRRESMQEVNALLAIKAGRRREQLLPEQREATRRQEAAEAADSKRDASVRELLRHASEYDQQFLPAQLF